MTEHLKTVKHIIRNKRIVLAAVVLMIVAIFLFAVDRKPTLSQANQEIKPEVDFVNKADENQIQATPVETAAEEYFTAGTREFDLTTTLPAICNYQSLVDLSATPVSSRRAEIPILMYHYVENRPATTTLPGLFISPNVFEAQLITLRRKCYQTIFVKEAGEAILNGGELSEHVVALTFDDGYEDMYTEAFPLLKKYGMKGTMYIIVNALDKPGYLTSKQAKEMAESGYVEIASHTLNHANLNRSNHYQAQNEIIDSKKALEKIIGQEVYDFAYPYGFFTSRDEELCRQAGYLTCASTYPGQVQTYDKRFSLYRLRPGYRVGPALTNWLEFAGPKR